MQDNLPDTELMVSNTTETQINDPTI